MANIEDNNIDWKVDCERLILFADIMGFKDRVITTEHYMKIYPILWRS